MLKVIPVQDKNEQERLCSLCGAEYIPEALAYAGYSDGGDFACIAQFKICAGYVKLCSLSAAAGGLVDEDVMLLCGLAALNFAYTIGIKEARCDTPDEAKLPLYRKIGFAPCGDGMRCDLAMLFEGHCR